MKKTVSCLVLSLSFSSVYADYREDIGYHLLKDELGATIPTGKKVMVTQVEAASNGAWMPDPDKAGSSDKTIIGGAPVFSQHATGVASLFYGNTGSMASGITHVDIYSAGNWLSDGALRVGEKALPSMGTGRIVNHSWVSDWNAAGSVDALKRTDWLVEEHERIQVTGMNNGTVNVPLLSSAYNNIAVGRTDGKHTMSSVALDSVYSGGRTRPDIVAPLSQVSEATPVISATAAMLIEQAHTAAQGETTEISNCDVIYHGERSEVVKAVMMAGADRKTNNVSHIGQIVDYRSSAYQSSNGLDTRFGAGQVNVYNNYQIIAAGEQNSQQDGGKGTVGLAGYDYDDSFGGQQRTATYLLSPIEQDESQLAVSLVWNINIETVSKDQFDAKAILYDLNLALYDVTDGTENAFLVASSQSLFDNTENLWYSLQKGRDYKLQVLAEGDTFDWDYGLAWKVSAVPVPAGFWLFLSAMIGLFRFRK